MAYRGGGFWVDWFSILLVHGGFVLLSLERALRVWRIYRQVLASQSLLMFAPSVLPSFTAFQRVTLIGFSCDVIPESGMGKGSEKHGNGNMQ
ncbi:hypothetical protein QBC44DRAFT_85709 [Cladorrhinum sp. PSN332]|nr:hypothetical protein QBC44DRAFT_85709 [Cladorrhinum sp. PSN332]